MGAAVLGAHNNGDSDCECSLYSSGFQPQINLFQAD